MKVSLRLSLTEFVSEPKPSALGCPFLYRKKAFGKLLLAAVGSEGLKQKPASRFRRSKASGKWIFPMNSVKSLRQIDAFTVYTQKPEANVRFHW